MIYLIIGATLLSLFLNLIDKKDLFKEPVTANKIIIISTIVVLSSIAGYIQIKSDIDQENSRIIVEGLDNKADSLLKVNDSLIIKSNLLKATVDTLRNENDRAHKSHEDSLKTFHYNTVSILGKYGLKVDTLKNTIEKYDHSTRAETLPTLVILHKPVYDSSNNESKLNFNIESLSENAHLVEGKYAFINVDLDNRRLSPKPYVTNSMTNQSTVLPKDGIFSPSIFIDRIKKQTQLSPEYYVAIEFIYKSKSGKLLPPLRKVYYVDRSNMVHDINNIELSQITKILEINNVWETGSLDR